MRKIYKKPVVAIEGILTDEIMAAYDNPENILSYNTKMETGGYTDTDYGFIKFNTGDANVINGINYDTFTR